MVLILQKENKLLRKKAKEVKILEINSPKIKKVIVDLKKALSSQFDGVAIAAPQIGVLLRIFVIAGRAFALASHAKKSSATKEQSFFDRVFINPKIVKISKEKVSVEEGCLSVRYLYGRVNRAKKVKIKAYDEKGELFEFGGSGLLAQIFQHEVDHLEGHLFIDKAEDIVELSKKEYERDQK
jgi:peptide deformylase